MRPIFLLRHFAELLTLPESVWPGVLFSGRSSLVSVFKRKLVIVLIKKAKRFRQSFERHLQGEKGKSILVGSPILYVQKTFTRCGREEDRLRVGATSSAAILRDRA